MKKDNLMRLLGTFALCLMCLWAAGGNARAADSKEAEKEGTVWNPKTMSYESALRYLMKKDGRYFGKSSHCYYTYTSNKKEIEIIGFQETVKKIRIPDKIKGKKVTKIRIENYSNLFKDSTYYKVAQIKNPKTKCIVISRYIKMESVLSNAFSQDEKILNNLEKIQVSSWNKTFMAKEGVLFSKNGKVLWEYPRKRKASNYKIPDGVTKVRNFAFTNAQVKKLTMPDTVKSVGSWSFASSRVQNIILSKNIKKIGQYAFNSTEIKKISLPDSLEVIQNYAFSDTKLKKISLPKGLKFVGQGVFSGTDLKGMVIPGNLKAIPAGCFSGCKKLEKVTIKKGVKSIKKRAFEMCYNLRKLIIPSSVNKIEDLFSRDPHAEAREQDEKAWQDAKLTIYVKKGSHAHRKFSKKTWGERLERMGIKVKTM